MLWRICGVCWACWRCQALFIPGEVQYILVGSAKSSCSLCATPLTWPHPVWGDAGARKRRLRLCALILISEGCYCERSTCFLTTGTRPALHVHTLGCTPTHLIYQMRILLPSPQLNITDKLKSFCWVTEPRCCQWSNLCVCAYILMYMETIFLPEQREPWMEDPATQDEL